MNIAVNLLAIESSSETLSVALLCDGAVIAREANEPRRHGALVLPLIEALLAEAGLARGQLDAIAFGRGPGAFTGVRLACSVAQGLGFGLDRPVLGVSTLQALALAGLRKGAVAPLLVLLDARMGELYTARYTSHSGLPVLLGEEELLSPDQLELPGDDSWSVSGTGWLVHRAALYARFGLRLNETPDAPQLPHAREICLLGLQQYRGGQRSSAFEAMPVYLRDKVAQTRAERLNAKAL
jgi:tRNA threonylcarbamoyladenosine biosynthesis protein TsaB